MAEIKWIKITTDIFSDEKIMLIEQMPEADTIIVIWFKLLCMAGRDNNNGIFLMNNKIAYTEEMFATIFRRPLNTVRLAISTFEAFGMIDIIDDVITLNNWEKHQNIDGMEKIREQNRLRKQKERERKKAALLIDSHDMSRDTSREVTQQNKKEDKEKEKDNNILSVSDETPPTKKAKPVKHRYGEYNNVLLTDDELEKLKKEYSDYAERIERLSSYVASTGKPYKSHYATIRNWARKDAEKPQTRKELVPDWLAKKNNFTGYDNQRNYDMDSLEAELLRKNKTVRVEDDPELAREAAELKRELQAKY